MSRARYAWRWSDMAQAWRLMDARGRIVTRLEEGEQPCRVLRRAVALLNAECRTRLAAKPARRRATRG